MTTSSNPKQKRAKNQIKYLKDFLKCWVLILIFHDIFCIFNQLAALSTGLLEQDDIDHLQNKRLR